MNKDIISKEEVEEFTKEHLFDPSPKDFMLIEKAMLKGAEIALEKLLDE